MTPKFCAGVVRRMKLPFRERGRLRGTGLDGWTSKAGIQRLVCSEQWDLGVLLDHPDARKQLVVQSGGQGRGLA